PSIAASSGFFNATTAVRNDLYLAARSIGFATGDGNCSVRYCAASLMIWSGGAFWLTAARTRAWKSVWFSTLIESVGVGSTNDCSMYRKSSIMADLTSHSTCEEL